MKVAAAGMPRNGTLSLYTGLNKLGFSCYHMKECAENFIGGRGDVERWIAAAEAKKRGDEAEVRRQIKKALKGYDAAVDAPAHFFWKDILAIWPKCKLLLNERDAEAWVTSVTNTVYYPEGKRLGSAFTRLCLSLNTAVFYRLPGLWHMACMGRFGTMVHLCWFEWFYGLNDTHMSFLLPRGRENAKRRYVEWNRSVERDAPKERFLKFHARDGYEPLCKFLGVPVPEGEAFPHVNDTKELQKMLPIWAVMMHFLPVSLMVLLASFAVQLYVGVFWKSILVVPIAIVLLSFALEKVNERNFNTMGGKNKGA